MSAEYCLGCRRKRRVCVCEPAEPSAELLRATEHWKRASAALDRFTGW